MSDRGTIYRKVMNAVRSIGQVVLTVILAIFDVISSGSGGAPSSVLPPVTLPRPESPPTSKKTARRKL